MEPALQPPVERTSARIRAWKKSRNDQVLDAALTEATIATFAHYDVPLTLVGPSPALRVASHYSIGVIGFAGEALRGTLVIATCMPLVSAHCPPGRSSRVRLEDRARDWVGELSNLVLGRVKIALSRRGVTMGLSTPVAFTGQHVRLGAVHPARTRAWDFASPAGEVRAWLEVDYDRELLLGPDLHTDTDGTLAAGDALLF
ncbi:MAG: chemotaxis protein CheX [Pseudomonadota bacterium]|nr:chemotaxis protein CheX [Pseudomonadota bacterium]